MTLPHSTLSELLLTLHRQAPFTLADRIDVRSIAKHCHSEACVAPDSDGLEDLKVFVPCVARRLLPRTDSTVWCKQPFLRFWPTRSRMVKLAGALSVDWSIWLMGRVGLPGLGEFGSLQPLVPRKVRILHTYHGWTRDSSSCNQQLHPLDLAGNETLPLWKGEQDCIGIYQSGVPNRSNPARAGVSSTTLPGASCRSLPHLDFYSKLLQASPTLARTGKNQFTVQQSSVQCCAHPDKFRTVTRQDFVTCRPTGTTVPFRACRSASTCHCRPTVTSGHPGSRPVTVHT